MSPFEAALYIVKVIGWLFVFLVAWCALAGLVSCIRDLFES